MRIKIPAFSASPQSGTRGTRSAGPAPDSATRGLQGLPTVEDVQADLRAQMEPLEKIIGMTFRAATYWEQEQYREKYAREHPGMRPVTLIGVLDVPKGACRNCTYMEVSIGAAPRVLHSKVMPTLGKITIDDNTLQIDLSAERLDAAGGIFLLMSYNRGPRSDDDPELVVSIDQMSGAFLRE